MQYAENGSLLQLVRKEKYLPEERAKSYFSQLISAVEYIHGMGVVHRDIKCENIVFDHSNTLKLIDFGFARGNMQPVLAGGKIKPVLSKTFCGSHAYASPEILKSVPYQPQLSDIWAVGVVLYTMVIGRLPFSNETKLNVLIQQTAAGPKFPKDRCISDECKSLIQKILQPANVRISIEEMRRQLWLTEHDSGYDDMSIEKRYEKKMKLDSSSDSSEGCAKVTISPTSATSGNRDDNNNNTDGKNCTTSQSVLNRKKAVPK
ncbi:testis-specific serine/threonine-protein kinase 2 isoform X3 [Armigeres subalbatus]